MGGLGLGPLMFVVSPEDRGQAGTAPLLLGLAGGGVMSARGEARERPERIAMVLDAGLAPSTLLLGR